MAHDVVWISWRRDPTMANARTLERLRQPRSGVDGAARVTVRSSMKRTHQVVCSFFVAAMWSATKRPRIGVPGLGLRIG
jgi:hypothetical protein